MVVADAVRGRDRDRELIHRVFGDDVPRVREGSTLIDHRGTIPDVTERRAGARRAHEETLLRTVLDTIDAAVVAVDSEGVISHWNAGAESLFGWDRQDALGRPLIRLGVIDGVQVRAALEAITVGGSSEDTYDVRHRDGTRFAAHVHLTPIHQGEGPRPGAIAVALDMRGRLAAQREVERAYGRLEAVTDSMVEGLLTLDGRGRVTTVNAAAEKLLGWSEEALLGEEMHAMIQYRRRDGSPYPISECPIFLARESGETVRVAEDTFICQDETELDVSYTVAPLKGGGEGLGVVVVFEDVSERRAAERRSQARLERLSWVGRIKDALDTGRMVPFAQPIVDLADGRVVKHELLVRMIDDAGSAVAPGCFLPAAEEHGLIVDIDRRMLDHAIELAAGGEALTVNLSGQTVTTAAMGELLGSKIALGGIDPSLLTIEVTETALIENEEAAERFLREISDLGCRFALDDFGTGYGGFSYLKRLSVDFLKIDMEFVRDLRENDASRRVVAAVVALARGFGQKTIAEGVEDEATMESLEALGVDYGQGYLFGKPALASDALRQPEGVSK